MILNGLFVRFLTIGSDQGRIAAKNVFGVPVKLGGNIIRPSFRLTVTGYFDFPKEMVPISIPNLHYQTFRLR